MPDIVPSPRGTLNKEDLFKLLKGAAVAAAGGLLAWASVTFIPVLQESGNIWLVSLAGVLAVGVNAVRKLLSGPTKLV